MPVLDPALIADVRAKLDEEFGAIDAGLQAGEQAAIDAGRTKMATVIAESAIFARANNLVNVTVPGVQAGSSTLPGTGTWG